MKNFIFSLCLLLSFNISSQIQTPAPSPATKVQQTIGLTNITLEYARPSVRDRVVFGNLVPFNKMWRTGANENSIISFSTSIMVHQITIWTHLNFLADERDSFFGP